MIRDVLRMGDPRLLRVSRPVECFDARLVDLLTDMTETMTALNGAGLAAPQIGVDLRVVIFGFEHNPRYPNAAAVPFTVLINPQIEPLGDEKESGWEGCLSLPGLRGFVPRFKRLRYSGFQPDGARIECVAEGFHARVVQHECDHLEGILYPLRMIDLTTLGFIDAPGFAGGAPTARTD